MNITADSAPGWLPSRELEQQVYATTKVYYRNLDIGQFETSYNMMDDGLKALEPLADFVKDKRAFHAKAGGLVGRKYLKLTWTKDPAHAPHAGVYAAIDIASQFENVDRHCGYLVLYQPTPLSGFVIMREESNFIDNASASSMERQNSQAALDQTWARLAANCPNYPYILPSDATPAKAHP